MSRFAKVWALLDEQVAAGRYPAYAAAVAAAGDCERRFGGDAGPDTLFRIASVTKPMGGVLALSLVQDGVIGLDDPVAPWLPEAASPRVLTSPAAPLDSTEPVTTPITFRHLLTGTSGWGVVMTPSPLLDAMQERGVYGSALPRETTADEFAARVCSLPLAFRPGEGWGYETGIDLLGIALMRRTGRSLGDLLAERVFGPLGMTSTAFVGDPSRLAVQYVPDDDGLAVLDPPDGVFARPSAFQELGSGLVSTLDDVARFFTAFAAGGAGILSDASRALLTRDALIPALREGTFPLLGPGESWAMGTSVDVKAHEPWMAPGRWGWTGGTGTTAYVDPVRGTVCVLLTQRAMTGPDDGFGPFWTAVADSA